MADETQKVSESGFFHVELDGVASFDVRACSADFALDSVREYCKLLGKLNIDVDAQFDIFKTITPLGEDKSRHLERIWLPDQTVSLSLYRTQGAKTSGEQIFDEEPEPGKDQGTLFNVF